MCSHIKKTWQRTQFVLVPVQLLAFFFSALLWNFFKFTIYFFLAFSIRFLQGELTITYFDRVELMSNYRNEISAPRRFQSRYLRFLLLPNKYGCLYLASFIHFPSQSKSLAEEFLTFFSIAGSKKLKNRFWSKSSNSRIEKVLGRFYVQLEMPWRKYFNHCWLTILTRFRKRVVYIIYLCQLIRCMSDIHCQAKQTFSMLRKCFIAPFPEPRYITGFLPDVGPTPSSRIILLLNATLWSWLGWSENVGCCEVPRLFGNSGLHSAGIPVFPLRHAK